ncbi:MAG: hypothetical protein LLF97_03650 [Planctomycetaceae bacterium]|nr:hypothetical protein [Planctomycetaceae bacterium]
MIFFGSGFFKPSVSPVLLKKFLVPELVLSHIEGSWTPDFTVGFAAGFGLAALDVELPDESENGSAIDQAAAESGDITAYNNTTRDKKKLPIELTFDILATMMANLSSWGSKPSAPWDLCHGGTGAWPPVLQDKGGSVAKQAVHVQSKLADEKVQPPVSEFGDPW